MQELFTDSFRSIYGPEHGEALDTYINNRRHIFNSSVFPTKSKSPGISRIRKYNFPLDPANSEQQNREAIMSLYDEVEPLTRFNHKLDIRLGGIIDHHEEPDSDKKEMRVSRASYFYPCVNTSILQPATSDSPGTQSLMSIGSVGEGRAELEERVRDLDLGACMNKGRPNTSSKLVSLSNVEFVIFQTGGALVGNSEESDEDVLHPPVIGALPEAVRRSRKVLSVVKHPRYKYCFWRALAYALGRVESVDRSFHVNEVREVIRSFVAWRALHLGVKSPNEKALMTGGFNILSKEVVDKPEVYTKFKCDISGLVSQVENCFNLNIYLYAFDSEQLDSLSKATMERLGRLPTAPEIELACTLMPVHVSCGKHGSKSIHLLLDGESTGNLHCYYIKKIHSLARNFRCQYCHRLFGRWKHCKRHANSECLSRFVYPGGPFSRQKLIWERLAEEDINLSQVPGVTCDWNVPWDHRLTWDIEAKVCQEGDGLQLPPDTPKVKVLGKHIAVSISVCSNVPHYRGIRFFFEENDPSKLLTDAYDHMCTIQRASESQWHERMSSVYAQIEERILQAGGRGVKMTEDRFRNLTPQLQDLYRQLASKEVDDATICDMTQMPPCSQGHVPPLRGGNRDMSLSPMGDSGLVPEVGGFLHVVDETYTSVEEVDDHLAGTCKEELELLTGSNEGVNESVNADEECMRDYLGDENDQSESEKKECVEMKRRMRYISDMKQLLRDVKAYGAVLPVFGFNSSKYDLGVLAEHFPKVFGLVQHPRSAKSTDHNDGGLNVEPGTSEEEVVPTQCDSVSFTPQIIGQTNNFKKILTKNGLCFLDLINYVPAGTSLDKLVKSYSLEQSAPVAIKGKFPYGVLSEPSFHQQRLLDPDTGKLISPESLYNNGETPCLFDDSFSKSTHRVQSNLLEREWSDFTRTYYPQKRRQVIPALARKLVEKDKECKGKDKDFKEGAYREYLEVLGFHSVRHQKPRHVDLEEFQLNYTATEFSPPTVQVRTGVEVFDEEVRKVIEDKQLNTYLDYLRYYNNLDVLIMHPVISRMTSNFRHMNPHIEVGRENVSLPNISRILGHQAAAKAGHCFHLAKGEVEGQVIERSLRRSLFGGPSLIFNRYASAYQTKTEGGHLVKCIDTEDANALYSRCMQKDMPVGSTLHYFGPDDFSLDGSGAGSDEWVYREIGKGQESVAQKAWLEVVQSELRTIALNEFKEYSDLPSGAVDYPDPDYISKIHTRDSLGTNIRLGPYNPDGLRHRDQFTDFELKKYPDWCRGVVYEYLGDYWHGNPEMLKDKLRQSTSPDDKHYKQATFLAKKLLALGQKLRDIIKMGYVVVTAWDSKFRFKGFNTKIWSHLREDIPPFARGYILSKDRSLTRDEVQKNHMSVLQNPDSFQALLMRDFKAEDVYSDKDIIPSDFFGVAEVDLEPKVGKDFSRFGPIFVSGVIEGQGHVSLTGVERVKRCLLTTPYIQCLCSIGMKITKVHRCWEYRRAPCFKSFVDTAVEERKKGDRPGGNPLQADLYKLVVNSTYGSLIQNKDRHGQIMFLPDEWRVCKFFNEPSFKDAAYLADGLVQVNATTRKIKQNVPVQLGKFILDYAKMHMINFYYHVLGDCCDMDKIDLVSMDTDSLTLSLAENDLDACVKPDKRAFWESSVRPFWFVHRGCGKKCQDPECNKRKPGPFKNEYYGDHLVGLSSKLFTVTSLSHPPKVACKGLTKDRLNFDDFDRFHSTLKGDGDLTVEMTSFQRKKASMLTLATSRTVSNRYLKRKLNPDSPERTLTLKETVDCGMPEKKRKVWEERKGVLGKLEKERKRKWDQSRL